MIWRRSRFELSEIKQWGTGQGPQLDPEFPTLLECPFVKVPWTLQFCFAPIGQQFQATFSDYPIFASRLAQLQESLWKPEGVGVGAFLDDFRRQGFKSAEIPNVLPLPRQLLPRGVGTNPVFSFSRFRAVPLVLPNDAVDGMANYLRHQVEQFQTRAFFPAARPVEPLQRRSVVDGVVDTGSPLYPLVLAFGLPPKLLTTERLLEARKALSEIVNGAQDKYPFQSVFRARPIFFRSDLRKVLVIDRAIEVPVELEEECNFLRAKMIRLLAWPELYGEVKNFLHADAPRWKSAEPKAPFTASLIQELEAYVATVELRYPVLLESP